jgi:hypothetical protein
MDKKNFDFIDLTVTRTGEEWWNVVRGIDILLERSSFNLLTNITKNEDATDVSMLLQFKNYLLGLMLEKLREDYYEHASE